MIALDPSAVEALAREAFPSARRVEVEPMPAGASTRRYFRVRRDDGASAVCMYVPDGHRADEIEKGGRTRRWPFLEVRDLLDGRGIRVPAVLADATDRGLLLIEDLGDDTIANHLARGPGRKEAVYRRAVADLARAQRDLRDLPAESVVRTRVFDEDLLRWEIDHFREWALEARGIDLGPADRRTFDEVAGRLAHRIASWPRGFVHRDYQSRNLMVLPDGTLAWLDFQDALLGPRVYDLVALLGDSYQTFERRFVLRRLDEYAGAMGLGGADRAALGREMDLVTVQRKLKDAGRFVFIDRTKHNSSFLPFVESTIAKARAALARLRDEADMRALDGVLDRAIGPAA